MTFAPGGIVRIDGLQAQSHLNGCVGKLRNIDAETGRWVVDVKENGRTTAKLLKEANLHSPEAADGDVVANRVESFSRLRADFARTVENSVTLVQIVNIVPMPPSRARWTASSRSPSRSK